ncbi:chaperonin GroEL [Solirhodobacter olei]|uniref:chaperonin GroEL n=1 Tax=Solirhodobacter olei TaxID=2493082 RepID=UPI000FD8B95F|nr:chaperonin GroEL [Solirhodobacter olei]
MSYKIVAFESEARASLLRGATALADAVRVTLGPKSKSVLIQKKWGTPIVCNDGVTIAKEMELKDPAENLGAQMLRQAAEKTGEAVGDGTSTSTVLAHAIFVEGVRNVVAGASAVDLRRGLDDGMAAVRDYLKTVARPVQSRREIEQVATISAHNDGVIGALVADAMEKVGRNGAITVEDARSTETELDVVDGMQFDRGYISPYFVTAVDTLRCELEAPYLLIHEAKLSALRPLVPLLEAVIRQDMPLLVIAEDVSDEALATLVVNKLRGGMKVAAVKAPGFGDRRRAMLEDIAVLTGGTLISQDLGLQLEKVTLDHLGRAQRAVVTKDDTTIVGGHGKRSEIDSRIAQIKQQIEDATSSYDKEKLEERLARLSGGVAVIRAGAPSEAELKSRKEALDDAISATRAAIDEGVVPGGGQTFLRAIAAVEAQAAKAEGDRKTGLSILARALEAPARQIAANSAMDGGVVIAEVLRGSDTFGFDAAAKQYGDMVQAGIIDPAKVLRVALENAVSVAGTLLLTEAVMTEAPEPEAKAVIPDNVGL